MRRNLEGAAYGSEVVSGPGFFWEVSGSNPGLAPHTAKTYQKFETKFPEKELRGHSPNSYIHDFVSDLYIPLIGLLKENRWEYIDRSQTHECRHWY